MQLVMAVASEHIQRYGWAAKLSAKDRDDLDCLLVVTNELGKIFRCLLVTGAGLFKDCIDWNTLMYNRDAKAPFIFLAGFSARPGHSETLIRLMLSALAKTQIQQLRVTVSKMPITDMCADAMDEVEADYVEWGVQRFLKYIAEIESSQSLQLQHLVRRSVLRALSGRSLPSVEALGIP